MYIMKTLRRFVFLFAMIVLTGCSTRELEFDRVYPDMTELDIYRAQLEKIDELTSYEFAEQVISRNIQPRDFIFISQTNDYSTIVEAVQYCWGQSFRSCEDMRAVYPLGNPLDLITSISVEANGRVKVSPEPIISELPYPTELQLYVYDIDRKIRVYDKVLNDFSNTFEFTVPAEAQSYVFMIKAIYSGKLHGVSYYPIKIDVK